MIGQTLDHYRIESKIGEGGMGVVYRAIDTRLDRPVALKVLPAEAVANPERKRRFVQEAKAASALNHPSIIHIYDIGNAGGVDFIAMEFVEGKTLDRLIGRKGLSVSEALKYAIQIADALARAHAAGIVHRDLKPANVMVKEEGLVKVLDFGLAKLTERDAESSELEATLSMAVGTPGSGRTEEGVILGTVAYMSPEQAQGKKVDARSDVFSFGSMLYEMVTARRPFEGENKMSTLAAILNLEPKLAGQTGARVPQELEKIIARCLRKDATRRQQTMADLRVALEDFRDGGETPPKPSSAAAPRWGLTMAAAAVLIAASAGATWWATRSKVSAGLTVLTRVTADEGLTTDPAISPNGSLLAYASDRGAESNLDIWVQPVPGGEPIRITRHQADDREPAFSPDGSKIAFRSEREGGGIYIVPALGGAERSLVRDGRRPRFSPDGKWIAYFTGGRGANPRTYVIPSAGGEPRPVAADLVFAVYPIWSPDSKHLLFAGVRKEKERPDWFIASVDDGKVVPVRAAEAFSRYGLTVPDRTPEAWIAEGDRVFFSSPVGDSIHLWQVAVSPESGRITGAPQQVTVGTSRDAGAALAVGPSDVRLFFSSLTEKVTIWGLAGDTGRAKLAAEPRQLTHGAAVDMWPSVSVDGKKLAFLSNRSSNWDVWLKSLEGGAETPLTATPLDEGGPEISADGTKVAYSAAPANAGLFYDKQTIYVAGAGGGVPEKICADCTQAIWDWSKDGKQLLVWVGSANEGTARLAVVDASNGKTTEVLKHPQLALYHARFSPDGRWIVFMGWKGADKSEKWIAPFRGPAPIEEREWIRITEGGALEEDICWSPDGSVLYFVSERDGFRCLYARRLDPASKQPPGPSWAVQHFHRARRSIIDTARSWAKISVARDKLVFSMRESTGNIWVAKWPK